MSVVQFDPITGAVSVCVARTGETRTEPHDHHADLVRPSDDPPWINALPTKEERAEADDRARRVQEALDEFFPVP